MVSTTSTLLVLCFVLNLFHISVAAESLDATHLHHHGPCKHPLQRKEWYGIIRHLVRHLSSLALFIIIGRALSDGEKKCYIEAVKCLQSRPAYNNSRPASWTRFDEFQGIHVELAFDIQTFFQLPNCRSVSDVNVRGNFFPGIDAS